MSSGIYDGTTVPERLAKWLRKDEASGCWLWTGHTNHGYGRIFVAPGRRPVISHRAAWQIANGKIPDGMWVLHKCDVPACCNPDHLFLGTPADNTKDMRDKGRSRWIGGPKGEKSPHAKLTEADVKFIRASSESGRDLAKRFGVRDCTISAVRLGRAWKHVGRDAEVAA